MKDNKRIPVPSRASGTGHVKTSGGNSSLAEALEASEAEKWWTAAIQ